MDDVEENIYLFEEGGGKLALLDTGYPGTAPKIKHHVEKNGFRLDQISRIILTHVHPDHVGSLRAIVDLTKARTFSHWVEAEFIAQRPAYDGPPGGGNRFDPVEVDEKFKDGDKIDLLGGLEILHTPGHTPGHISLYSEDQGILLTGDLFFNQGGNFTLTPPMYTHHTQSAIISARRVAKLKFDRVLTYHGPPILEGGKKRVEELVKTL